MATKYFSINAGQQKTDVVISTSAPAGGADMVVTVSDVNIKDPMAAYVLLEFIKQRVVETHYPWD